MMKRWKKYIFYYAGLILAINGVFFGSLYFFNYTLSIWLLFLIHFVTAFTYWMMTPINVYRKTFIIFISLIISSVMGFILMLSTMYIPGSKEHNYVMYQVCMPKLEQYYKERGLRMTSQDQQSKNGQYKWWYQHSECEDNVYKGVGPIFTDNPPGFIPKSIR